MSHKYGVQLPSTVKEAYDLDGANGYTLWSDALNKEMENLKVAFDILLIEKLIHFTIVNQVGI